ncbi:MAG: hypothetical protein IID28_11265 [Planctomycetes bacterium]|nr:hypothetical protein [Planctomycetota bacterium]
MHLRKVFLWSMIASLALAALLGIAALVLPRYGPDEEVLVSTALFVCFSIVALMCATVLERRRAVAFMWAGLGSAVAALLVWLTLIWFDSFLGWSAERVIVQIAGMFTIGALLAAQSGLLALPRFDTRRDHAIRRATIGVSVFLATDVVILIWWYDQIERVVDGYILGRAVGVLSIIAACGTVVTPILWKVQSVKRGGAGESIPLDVEIRIVCPRCHHEQALKPGKRACAKCSLRISIELEEPRCACGYLLHRLENDRCPECGRAVEQRDRWAAGAGSLQV